MMLCALGKARYIGASSMFAWQFAKSLHVSEMNGWAKFISMQNHYNLVYREEEREMIPLMSGARHWINPMEPNGARILCRQPQTRRWRRNRTCQKRSFCEGLYFREEDFTVADRAAEVAKERGVTASQIALAWVLNKPHIHSPIIGSSKMDHLDQAIAALEIKLSDEENKRLEELYQPHPILGHSVNVHSFALYWLSDLLFFLSTYPNRRTHDDDPR